MGRRFRGSDGSGIFPRAHRASSLREENAGQHDGDEKR
jgi:hypothetical protein